jgi:hypothetical protein
MLFTVPPTSDSLLWLRGLGASRSATSPGSARPQPPIVFVTGNGELETNELPVFTVGNAVPASGDGRGFVTAVPAPFGVVPIDWTVDWSMWVPGAGAADVPEGCWAAATPQANIAPMNER